MKHIFIFIVGVILCISSYAQTIGSKVSLTAVDGKAYTGTITKIQGDKYNVKYDGFDFEAWLTGSQFTVTDNPSAAPITRKNTYQRNEIQQTTTDNTNTDNNVPQQKSTGAKPTIADVTKVIKADWEKGPTSMEPKKTVTINDIKFGASEKSNYAMQLEGVPIGALVTHAKIDFTENKFYNNETQHVRRIMTAWVYRDQFGEWAVMNTYTAYPDK